MPNSLLFLSFICNTYIEALSSPSSSPCFVCKVHLLPSFSLASLPIISSACTSSCQSARTLSITRNISSHDHKTANALKCRESVKRRERLGDEALPLFFFLLSNRVVFPVETLSSTSNMSRKRNNHDIAASEDENSHDDSNSVSRNQQRLGLGGYTACSILFD